MPSGARLLFRDATTEHHRRVDRAFSAFDLSRPDDYRRFLSAHARALPALETVVNGGSPWSGWSPLSPGLAADLRDAGGDPPPSLAFGGQAGEAPSWGVQYVLEGSRLGARVLALRVAGDFPQRYLGGVRAEVGWSAFQRELEQAAGGEGAPWREVAIDAARRAFEVFEAAATLELRATA